MSRPARGVLARLRRLGVAVEREGDRLRVDAPVGIVSTEERSTLAALKNELLATLDEERRVLDLSLSQFERSDRAIEVRVSGLDETLWFVPRVEQVAPLVYEGIARGRIWTARELADVASIPAVTPDDLHGIARVKSVFGAEIVDVKTDTDAVSGAGDARK